MVAGRRIEPDVKRDKVLSAARRLFVERGFYRVSIPDIVKESGVSIGAIYHHFGNKETLAEKVHDLTIADFQARMEERLEGIETTREKLRVVAELFFEVADTEPDMMEYMLFMKHGKCLDACPPLCFTEPLKFIRSIIAEGMERGEVRSGNLFVSSVSYMGGILRAVELWIACGQGDQFRENIDELIHNCWTAIKA